MDEKFLALLGDGDPQKAEERYRRLFHIFRRYFEWRGCDDPEGLAQTVFERGLEKLRDGAEVMQSGVGGFLYGFAKNIFRETLKPRRTAPIDKAVESRRSTHSDPEKALLIKEYLQHLEPEERRLLVDYINGRRARNGESAESVRIRIYRIRQKLLRLDGRITKGKKAGEA